MSGAVWGSCPSSNPPPVPKKLTNTGLNDHKPISLTYVVIKSFDRFVLNHLKDITEPLLDPLQVAYWANRSVDDRVNMGLHFIFQHLEKHLLQHLYHQHWHPPAGSSFLAALAPLHQRSPTSTPTAMGTRFPQEKTHWEPQTLFTSKVKIKKQTIVCCISEMKDCYRENKILFMHKTNPVELLNVKNDETFSLRHIQKHFELGGGKKHVERSLQIKSLYSQNKNTKLNDPTPICFCVFFLLKHAVSCQPV